MNNRVHQQFGNYQLLRLIGKGGFAEVYLGEHLQLGSQVAVKILNTQLMTREKEEFLEEAHIVGSLHHPSIIQILDCGIREEDDTPFLVMNYAPNGTLRQRHPKGEALALPLVTSYVKQIASALQYAHNKKLIHRDVKPENMLIGAEQELLLSDFGIALISSSSSSQSTKATAGTMAYMAPEQIMGKPRMASDQYALGVVAYEWLCGERPFHGNFSELCAQHLYAPPPSLREKNPAISNTLEKIIFKALAKDPLQRYATIRDFGEALEHYSQLVEKGEEEEEDSLRAEATQIRGMHILPVEQNEDRNTIRQIDSIFLPAELADAPDTGSSQQGRPLNNRTDIAQQDKGEVVYTQEKTLLTTPFNIYATVNTMKLVQENNPVLKNVQAAPQLAEDTSKDARRARLHLEKRHLLTLLMIVLVIGGSLGLTPLIFNTAYKDPGQSVYAQLAPSDHTPTPGISLTPEKSPTSLQPSQLPPAVKAIQAPQLTVITGNTGPTTTFSPTATPTRIVKSATPIPALTVTPTPTPIITPTPTPTPGMTATPTSPVTPTPAGIQPTLQSNPANIVNGMGNACGGDSHGGVGYVNYCNLTLANTSGSTQVLNWTGSANNTNYQLSPSSGSIAPGQSEAVSVTIGSQCPLSFTITFTGQVNRVTVPIICTQISVTPDAHSFSSSNCTQLTTGYWNCNVTVKAYTSNVADTNWSVTATTTGPYFSPTGGTLAPGASVQVAITIPPSSCPGTSSFNFLVPGSTVDGFDNYLAWSC